ncbi:helix-turn-helix domain-containing protein [Brevibacillus fluminis]|uniref:helix-turn-helix domain-containing protein n=1 Tax=Brevibacillus fluminis TaxID=511487 RepID=UPI003F8A4E22
MLETVGQRIRRLRKEKGWTQEQFAVRVNVSAQKVSNWERDYTPPGADDVAKIAEVCDSTSDFILTGRTDDPTPSDKRENLDDDLIALYRTVERAFADYDSLPEDEKQFIKDEIGQMPETIKWKLEEYRKHKKRYLEIKKNKR